MTRQQLERHQVWVYLGAITAGLTVGTLWPAQASAFEPWLWPVLGVLLYATFTQVPLTHLPDALRDVRFMGAVLAGNFLVVPLLVAVLLTLLPAAPAIRLGVLLVLLVPCTDWFVTFTHLGGGDTRRALAVTPLNLLVQLVALPVLLWLFMGRTFIEILAVDRLARVFGTLIVMPLIAAYLTERAVERRSSRAGIVAALGWLPVPLLGLVVFLIAASQVPIVVGSAHLLGPVIAVFVLYLVGAATIAVVLARVVNLPTRSARTLVFSLGTRNSFVVLPFALALPDTWAVAVVVVVLQSLIELWGMVAYLWIVPRVLRLTGPDEQARASAATTP
jgi:ACR3 family arsenite transporter